MAAWSGGSIQWCLLLLLLLPILLLAQDDCSHNCKNEANRYYYVRPEGSAETLCPAQPCLTPSQLREHFSECERNNSCQTANTSLVLLPGTYTSASNHGSFIPGLRFLSLTGYNDDCNTDSLTTPRIDCNGTWISLMFQHIKCLHIRNCVVFTGHGTTVDVDYVTFHDTLIRLASITAADHSELDYNYTLGSQSYCLLQKQLADINTLVPSNSVLGLTNVSFSSDYHTTCAREYGIQFATIHATDSALHIADCLFTQNAVTHVSLLNSTLHTLGMVQFENANTALIINSSTLALAGVVNFFNNDNSAIQGVGAFHNAILLAGTVEFTNNTADNGGAVYMLGGKLTIADNAEVVFQVNRARKDGGAINSYRHVTIAGSVLFINNSATFQGGAINSWRSVNTANNSHVIFQDNHAIRNGGAIISGQHDVTIAGSVQFINNSADQAGAINCAGSVIIADNAQVVFQSNHADVYNGGASSSGGAISSWHVTIAGSVQFINNSAYNGGAMDSGGSVTISDNAQVVFQGNHAESSGGAVWVNRHATIIIAGSVLFINNSARYGGAIYSVSSVTIADGAQVIFQGNHGQLGGGIVSEQRINIAGTVQFIENSANHGGGAIVCHQNVTIYNNAQVLFQANHTDGEGGAIVIYSSLVLAGSVQFLSNTAQLGGAIAMFPGNMTVAKNAKVVFQGNHAYHVGGAI